MNDDSSPAAIIAAGIAVCLIFGILLLWAAI